MYTQFFNLKQAPFSIAPDPRYLFMTERHRDALAHLLYGVGSGGGFVLLTGEIGAGKTTICRCFLEQTPANCNVAYIFNPKLTVAELLQSICDEFRIACKPGANAKHYVDALTTYLLAAHADGQNNVLVIDEAQNLSAEVLEQLRLLTNLETNERKLLQIILIGQPELRAMLARPELVQLAQRVLARYHLDALSAAETASYIRHRLSVAGTTPVSPFRLPVLKQIHKLTHGVPRRINLLCDRALLGAYAEGKHAVDHRMLGKAAAEVFGKENAVAPLRISPWRYAVWGVLASATIAGAAAWTLRNAVPMNTVRPAGILPATVTMAHKDQGLEKPAPSPSSGLITAAGAAGPDIERAPPLAAVPWDMDDPSNTGLRDRNNAIRQLAQRWGMSSPDQGLPCLTAQKENLHCYISANTDLAEIRQLDRPAVLTLRDDNDRVYYALLTRLTDTSATLQVGDVVLTVSSAALARQYKGSLVMLWRAPYTYRELVALGYEGEEAGWIAAQLAKMDGLKESSYGNQVFDKTMARKVREFQRAQGMKVDGVVGPKTYMHFNRVAGVAEPHLQNKTVTIRGSSGE